MVIKVDYLVLNFVAEMKEKEYIKYVNSQINNYLIVYYMRFNFITNEKYYG
tara:strand:- start:856 stop:1008 length:153 start_codon:yes stop_codon:yes gene_type:complete